MADWIIFIVITCQTFTGATALNTKAKTFIQFDDLYKMEEYINKKTPKAEIIMIPYRQNSGMCT